MLKKKPLAKPKAEKKDVENGETIGYNERSYYGTRKPKSQPRPSQVKKGKK